jgi:hypothetical protein
LSSMSRARNSSHATVARSSSGGGEAGIGRPTRRDSGPQPIPRREQAGEAVSALPA